MTGWAGTAEKAARPRLALPMSAVPLTEKRAACSARSAPALAAPLRGKARLRSAASSREMPPGYVVEKPLLLRQAAIPASSANMLCSETRALPLRSTASAPAPLRSTDCACLNCTTQAPLIESRAPCSSGRVVCSSAPQKDASLPRKPPSRPRRARLFPKATTTISNDARGATAPPGIATGSLLRPAPPRSRPGKGSFPNPLRLTQTHASSSARRGIVPRKAARSRRKRPAPPRLS